VRAARFIQQFGPDGGLIAEAGRQPGLGLGDGGPPDGAPLNGELVESRPDGELVLGQSGAFGGERSRIDQTAVPLSNGALQVDSGREPMIRVLVPPTTQRALAAITPATYSTLASGRISYVSTFAGTAQVRARRGTRTVAELAAQVAAGEGSLVLPSPIPRGNLRLTLTVTAPDGRVAVARLAVSTVKRLARPRVLRIARRFARSNFPQSRPVGCRRTSALTFDCAIVDTFLRLPTPPGPAAAGYASAPPRRCLARMTAVLRPDGVRAYGSGGRRACRRLARDAKRKRNM
jgi:hypothetical protein